MYFMKIELKKFGNLLTSRQDGREGVITLTPSWADEFVTKLVEQFGDRIVLSKTNNPSVKATLDLLERLSDPLLVEEKLL